MNFDRRLLRLAARRWPLLLLAVGSGGAAAALAVAQAGLLSRVVAQVFLGRAAPAEVAGALQLLLGLIGLRLLVNWGGEAAAIRLAQQIKDDVRRRLAQRLAQQAPAALAGEQTGELSSLALEGVEALESYYSQYLPAAGLALIAPLVILAAVLPLDPLSGVVLLLTAPLIPLFMALIGGWAQALTRRQWGLLQRLSAYLLDVLQGLTTLKMYGRSREQVQRIAQVSERFRQATLDVLRVAFLSALALELLATLGTAVIAVEVGLRLLYGRIGFEGALFVLVLAPEFYLPLRTLGARFHSGMPAAAAAGRLFAVLDGTPARPPAPDLPDEEFPPDVEPPPAAEPQAAAGSLATPQTAPQVRFIDVHYCYPGGQAALRGVTLDLPAGGVTALVGPSGGGKSTLAALLLRLDRPERGAIQVDGQPLEQVPLPVWRQQIAWAPQAPYLFPASLVDNVRLGRPQAGLDEVIEACRLAGADAFIRQLPEGYQTRLGERAARLSGGQAQRLALARAFLSRARLVVLDEPTSQLDPANQAAVRAGLERLRQGRTLLVIAHRLETVRQADQIVVIDGGQVIEQGTHAELLARDGAYCRLVEASSGSGWMDGAAHPAAPVTAAPPSGGTATREAAASLPAASRAGPALDRLPAQPLGRPGSRSATLLRLLRLARPFAGLALGALLAGAATVLSGVGLMAASAYILSAAALQPSVAVLQTAIVGVRFFGIARATFRYLERYLSHSATFRLLSELRVSVYRALEPLAPACLLERRSGDLLTRLLGDIAALESFYVRAVAPPGAALFSGLGVALLLAWYAPRLAVAWLALYGLAALLLPPLALRLGRAPARLAAEVRPQLGAAWVEGLQGLPDLLVFGRAAEWADRVDKLGCQLNRAQARSAGLAGLANAVVTALGQLALWLVLWLAVPLVWDGRLEGVLLAGAALAALAGFEALAPLPAAALHLEGSLAAGARLFEITDQPPAVVDADPVRPADGLPPALNPASPALDPASPALDLASPALDPAARVLEFDRVGFAYPGGDQAGVADISFCLRAGQRLAVVGESGAGKSTLAALLLRFWEPQQGRILLHGEDVRRLSQNDVRARLAVAPQSAHLFNASIEDNLRLACPASGLQQARAAARLAGIDERILALPDGYQSWAGEGGLRLSGGERQRLSLARALLRLQAGGAALLVLDEPFANLDALSERQALENVLRAGRGRALLLITHRLVGMEAMDEILVMEAGRVVERGRHAGLLQQAGRYRRMWDLAQTG
ncbi:MAG: thiol reductant ABC exporter subunit CydD [Chloroflexota bacterium]